MPILFPLSPVLDLLNRFTRAVCCWQSHFVLSFFQRSLLLLRVSLPLPPVFRSFSLCALVCYHFVVSASLTTLVVQI